MDYLNDRPQFLRLGRSVSEQAVSGTGAPQGTVLSPFLFSLYTSDFQCNSEACHLQKFSDDTAEVGCISGGDETEYSWWITLPMEWGKPSCFKCNKDQGNGGGLQEGHA